VRLRYALTRTRRSAYKPFHFAATSRLPVLQSPLALRRPPRETEMANTSSAKKAVRKIARRTSVNRARRSKLRTFLRKVEEAIASGDATAAAEALQSVAPIVMRAAQRGVIHKNTASRKVSRLSSRVKALAAAV
jgi:small subunit ribosomal protein S20